jgi:hypothetical protein
MYNSFDVFGAFDGLPWKSVLRFGAIAVSAGCSESTNFGASTRSVGPMWRFAPALLRNVDIKSSTTLSVLQVGSGVCGGAGGFGGLGA